MASLSPRSLRKLSARISVGRWPVTRHQRSKWWTLISAIALSGSCAQLFGGVWRGAAPKSASLRIVQLLQRSRTVIVETVERDFLNRAAVGTEQRVLTPRFLAALPKLQVPTLAVCGADDQGTPPAGNKRIAELVPGGRYEEIADARHLPNVERADAFNRILLDWLEARR